MKKITAITISALMMFTLAFASFAETASGGISGELRQAADSVNIAEDAREAGSEIESLYNQGVHVFDTAGLLTDDETAALEEKLAAVEAEAGFTVAVFTSDGGNSEATSAEDYADMIYYYGELGTDEDKDGVILVIDMYAREVYIYTQGIATRYITDSMRNYIYDEQDGGLYGRLSDGDYAGACDIFADGVQEAYQGGISSDQQNYDVNTGKYDSYTKKSISLFEIIVSAIISFICAWIPISSIKRKYAMKSEKKQAQGFNMAYRADATYAFTAATGAAAAAKLLSKNVTSIPIPRPTNTGGGGGSHGGGISSGSVGRGGSFHGGGGRSF